MARDEHEVRAYVEARLLGMRLLSLRAHVITGPPASPAVLAATPATRGRGAGVNGSGGAESAGLARAIDLLTQSSSTLKQLSAADARRSKT